MVDAISKSKATSSTTSNSPIAANTLTSEKPTGAAGGKNDTDLESKIKGLLKDASQSDTKKDKAVQELTNLVKDDSKAKDILTNLAKDDKQIAPIAVEVLKNIETTEATRNKNAPVIAKA